MISSTNTVTLGSRGGAILNYELPTATLVSAIPGLPIGGRTDAVTCLGVSADGRFLADGHLIGTLNLRLSESPTQIWKRFVLNDSVQSLAFSPDNQWLAVGDRGGTITLFPVELDAFSEAKEFFAGPTRRQITWNAHDGRIYGLSFTSDGQHLVSAGSDGCIIRWSPMSEDANHHQTDWTARVLTFEPQGSIVAIGGSMVRYSRGEDQKWTVKDSLDSSTWNGPHGRITVAQDSGLICWIRESETSIRAMTAAERELGIQWQAEDGDRPGMIAVSPDGQLLAIEIVPADTRSIGDNPDKCNRYLSLVERESKREIARIPCNTILDLAFSPNSQMLTLAVSRDVLLVDTATGAVQHRLPGHTITASGLAFSPDGQILATVGGRTLKLWDTGTGESIWSVTAHALSAMDVAFTPDGQTVMTIGEDSMLRCWRWGVQQMTLEIPLVPGPVRKLHISPDGRTAVVRYRDERVLVFDTFEAGIPGLNP